jgi:hypothetical protein
MSNDDRLYSFLRTLLTADTAAMLFFLIVRPAPVLPTTLPFQLGGDLAFKWHVIALAVFAAAPMRVKRG